MNIIGTSLKTKLVKSKLNFRFQFTSIIFDTEFPLKKIEKLIEKPTLQVCHRSHSMKGRKLKSRNQLTKGN